MLRRILYENQKRLYNLVIKIIETENISDEESSLLKDFLKSHLIEINNDNMNTNINITCALYHKDMWYSAQVKKAEYIIN